MAAIFYDREGKQLTSEEFGRLFSDNQYKFIELSESDEYVVSTVWLGLDHNFGGGDGPPVIFETLVFPKTTAKEGEEHSWSEVDGSRYTTEDLARAGHRTMCDKWGVIPFKFEPAEGQRFKKVIE